MKQKSKDNAPSWYVSLIPIAVLMACLAAVIKIFGSDALSGGSQVALLLAAGVAVAISMIFYKQKWENLEESIVNNIKSVSGAILILFMIGAISGSWMISGIVPTLIYYGVQVLTPKIFLLACCLICAAISVITGSSWTTIATIGVALLGIGTALGFSPGWTAGAIISGAYFGDKISPLSDTTVLASSSSGTPLFTHIRYMMITTTPSFIIASVIFLIASLTYKTSSEIAVNEFRDALGTTFNISPWLLLIPVITCILIARKVPAVLTLFISALLAGAVALFAQPDIMAEIAGPDAGNGFAEGFKGLFITYYGSTAVDTGNETLNGLISTRGMTGMLNTVFLIIVAAAFGGVMVGSGMLRSITGLLMRCVTKPASTVASTVCGGIFCNMATGDQYLSIILTSSLFKKLYETRGYENRLLSRSVEDSATVTSVLIPWNSCSMTQATVLKIPTLEFLPFCFFNLISPLMSVFIAAIGYKIVKPSTFSKTES